MNPKKRFHQILSVILTAAMLFSPAAFAQAGEMVIVPDYGEMTYEQANALFPEDYPIDTHADTPSVDAAPADTTPVDTTPVDTAPADTTPVDTTPAGTGHYRPSPDPGGIRIPVNYEFGSDSAGRNNDFAFSYQAEPVFRPVLPPVWGEGFAGYVDDALAALDETEAGEDMTIRADKSGMTTVSRTLLEKFEERGDVDLVCIYDRFGETMKLVIPAGTSVIEHIGNASFVEFHNLANLLGLTPEAYSEEQEVPEDEDAEEPELSSEKANEGTAKILMLDQSDAAPLQNLKLLGENVSVDFLLSGENSESDAEMIVNFGKDEDKSFAYITASPEEEKTSEPAELNPDDDGTLTVPIARNTVNALVEEGYTAEGQTQEETAEGISSLLGDLLAGMNSRKDQFLQPEEDVSIMLVFNKEEEKAEFDESAREPADPAEIAAAAPAEASADDEPGAGKNTSAAVWLYGERTADLTELLSLDKMLFNSDPTIKFSENASEALQNNPEAADEIMAAILAIDNANNAESEYSFDLGNGESVTFTYGGIRELLKRARERVIYKDEEERKGVDEALEELIRELLEADNKPAYTTYKQEPVIITFVFTPDTGRTQYEEKNDYEPVIDYFNIVD